MIFSKPFCPTCGSPAGGIIETMLAVAGIDMNDDGTFDYTGDSHVTWDTQEPLRDDIGYTLTCSRCPDEWATDIILKEVP